MLSIYPAYFYKENDGGYTVILPDWNNAATCGDDFNEAMAMAIDLLAGLIYDAAQNGISLPKPTPFEELNPHIAADILQCSECELIPNMISVDAEDYADRHFRKCVRKNITIFEWQNREGIRLGINFSQLMQNALTEKIAQLGGRTF